MYLQAREENENLVKALAFLEKQLEMTISKYTTYIYRH